MRKILAFCFVALVYSANAQTISVGTGTVSTLYGPIYIYSSGSTNTHSWNLAIYSQAELLAAGAYASDFTSISWNKLNNGAYTTPDAIFQVYLKHTSIAEFTTAADFNVEVTGATMVYDNNAMSLSADTGWINFPFTTNFSWNGTDNIMVLTRWVRIGSGTDAVNWQATATAPLTMISHSFNSSSTMGTLYTNGNRSNIRISIDPSTSISDKQFSNPIYVYPNPAQNFLNITKPVPASQLIITDLTGRTVFSKLLPEGVSHNIELPVLAVGLYSIRIFNESSSWDSRIVIRN